MLTTIVAGVVTLGFTTLLTIAGVGAAFILIPMFISLGIDIHEAMSTALLLNAVAMSFASVRYVKNRLVVWDVAIPILVVASILSPVGAWISGGMNREMLLWLFVGFLLFAASMMLFYESKQKEFTASRSGLLLYGGSVGAFAGFLGGLLGVGGGNIIVPVLVWLGFDPKKASATTSFIVIFSSISGFMGHASFSHINWTLLGITTVGSAVGALAGSWLMTEKLRRGQVKLVIGLVLFGIAAKMIFDLIWK